MKRMIAIFLCLLMIAGAVYTVPGIAEDETAALVYDAADTAGTVVNADDPGENAEESAFAATPLDVVLVLDVSGSMSTANRANGKQLISYAQDAAVSFCDTLFALNPESRVSVVAYDTYVRDIIGMTGPEGRNRIASAVRALSAGSSTNTGGGYANAVNMLNSQARQGCNQVILMLTDGLANEGASDPVQYAIDQGRIAAGQSMVYTIGLVGGMSEQEKRITRQVLNSGYETRYFEVDFDSDVGDISVQLSSAFVSIAAGGSIPDGQEFYRLWVDGAMDVRITAGDEYLSSAPGDYRASAPFGAISMLGDGMDQKLVMLRPGDYVIRAHGITTGRGRIELTGLSSRGARERTIYDQYVQTTPAQCLVLELIDGQLTVHDLSYDPLDLKAIDPFTGKPTKGSEMPVTVKTGSAVDILAAPAKNAVKIEKVKAKTPLNVLATDRDTGYLFVSFTDRDGLYSRGWVAEKSLKNVDGYVPAMIWINPAYERKILTDAQAMRAPGNFCAKADKIRAGTAVTVVHAERDTDGKEWAYVKTVRSGKPVMSYIPADAIEDWEQECPADFRIAYGVPRMLWQVKAGDNNFTEVMWVSAQNDGSGVVLSGRTSSTKGVLKAKYKNRDSFAMLLDKDGKVEKAVTHGGSDWDSYHCIIPDEQGFYVAGVTRSNDKDFDGIWDPSSTTGTMKSTTKKTNALIGHLDDQLNIDWLHSYGVGSVSYGFDMILKLADGTIAGEGWLTASRDGTQQSYGAQDFYTVKLDADGNRLDAGSYGWSANDVPDSGVATPDGGMILVGSTESRGSSDGLILIIDRNLNLVNSVVYGGNGTDTFDNIRPLPDGTYLVTGFTSTGTRGGLDYWAMKVDDQGRCIWTKTYGGSGRDELCGTTVLEDGRCILVGMTYSDDGNVTGSLATSKQCDGWAVCIDGSGRILWQFAAGGNGNDYFNAAAMDPADGGIVLGGICDNASDKRGTGFVIKIMP